MKRAMLFTIAALIFITFLAYSQTSKERIKNARSQITSLLATHQESPYEVSEVIDVDSSKGNSKVANGNISDPYGTLNRCYLFMARTEGDNGKYAIGVYRDNQILWMSDLLSGSQYYGPIAVADVGFLVTRDLNRMGNADIVVYFSDGTNPPSSYYLWIFSWNGSNGECVNQRESDGGTGIASTGSFEVFDVDGDGRDEIVSHDSDLKVNGIYSWNGSLYGEWPNSPNLVGRSYTVANNFTGAVRSVAVRNGQKLMFSYDVANDVESKQSIVEVVVNEPGGLVDSVTSPVGWRGGHRSDRPLVTYLALGASSQVSAGSRKGGFTLFASGLPTITSFYLQAASLQLDLSDKTIDELDEMVYRDMLSNSFGGFTIAAGNPQSPLVPLNFVDTLSSYTSQSRSLGWIKDQATANKYLGCFASTKSQLQANNTAGARTTLQTVLQDVNVDSTSNLTSEAYALIRYNTEYLLGQLPTAPPPSGLGVKLINSAGTNLTGGSLQYYDGSWKDAVNNNDGTFNVNTTLATVSLRMTYEGGSQTKSNVTVGPSVVVFQTVNTQVKLQNSQGASIDTGTVQYYYSSWQALGRTMNGVASKELLPGNYTFRMAYASATNDKQQDIGTNPTVVFTTVNAAVQLKNSQGNFIDQGTVQYYFSSWQNLGHTMNGVATAELLPGNYTFRMAYAYATNDKQQNIGTNPTVVFTTVNATVQLKNSSGNFIDQGTVQYYFSSWQALGHTMNGVATAELLPGNYTFRMAYAFATNDKQQNIGTNPTVVFSTVNATVQLKNSQGTFIDQGTVQYYFSSWQALGHTVNGVATAELLPASYTFRMTYETVTNDKVQNISTNSTVNFATVLCTVTVKNGQGQPVDGAQVSYYFSSWVPIGATVGGQVTKELLPASMTFRETIGSATQNKVQNIGTNALVEFSVQ